MGEQGKAFFGNEDDQNLLIRNTAASEWRSREEDAELESKRDFFFFSWLVETVLSKPTANPQFYIKRYSIVFGTMMKPFFVPFSYLVDITLSTVFSFILFLSLCFLFLPKFSFVVPLTCSRPVHVTLRITNKRVDHLNHSDSGRC